MRCPLCAAENDATAEACFTCGRAFDALTQGFVLAGRYEVRRLVGRGGMGRVYEAFDRLLEEPVAIKVLRAELTGDPDVARRFLHEIKVARRITHPRVCRIHEYGRAEGLAYISMEYIAGRSLKECLAGGSVTFSDGFDLALQIAEGLAAIHHHGIVHRDLKSANIMVDERGRVKILDFGIAKQTEGETAGLTAGDRIFGTPEYMSPEQVEGGAADTRSDVYALGCVVFEIFTGKPPFQAETPYATLLKHLKEPPPLEEGARALPKRLLPVLATALAKARAERFRSAAEFMAALRAARDDEPMVDGPGAPTPAAGARAGHPDTLDTVAIPRDAVERPRRWRWAWPTGVGAVVALGIVVGVTRGTRDPMPTPGVSAPATLPAPREGPPDTTVPSPPSTIRSEARIERARPRAAAATVSTTLAAPPATESPSPVPSSAPAVDPRPTPSAASAAPISPATPAPAGGTLALMVVPDADVVLDGVSIGTTGQRDIPLSPGPHKLEVRHPDYLPLPRSFTIRAAQTTTLILDLQEKGIPRRPNTSK
jgi:predicted Ser/Thr protein kinase